MSYKLYFDPFFPYIIFTTEMHNNFYIAYNCIEES